MGDWEWMPPPGAAETRELPEVSPYTDTARFGKPKETFKATVAQIRANADVERPLRLADVGCANGEFLYWLGQEFPHWELAGFDEEPAFIDVARSHADLADVRLEVRDLFDLDELGEQFDVVTLLGVFSTLQDPMPPLEKLLSVTAPGGLLIVGGYFNPYDVEVRVVYCDNSVPESRGKWRIDWTRHSQRGLREALASRCESVEFHDVVMNAELPRDPQKPHIFAWTFKDEHGRNIITNGTHFMINDVLMVIRH